MMEFDLSTEVLTQVAENLELAERFIKIAIFQVQRNDIFEILNKKLKQGIKVEIFTLPVDSINIGVRESVEAYISNFKQLGGIIHFCKWNVGDPERTTTVGGRWYSYHGKFLVTDKSAIILSANLTKDNELDSLLVIKDAKLINSISKKFDELVRLFIFEEDSNSIRKLIRNTKVDNLEKIFSLPDGIKTVTHENYWVRHYPIELCPEGELVAEKLYICPFDIRARVAIEQILLEAKKFIYISTETFTDEEISLFIKKISTKKSIKINIITGVDSMDFQNRINDNFLDLVALGLDLRTQTRKIKLHAKLLITDKHLMISSLNLNKMNLGFYKTKKSWRANTETFYLSSDLNLLKKAKQKYEDIFSTCKTVQAHITKNLERKITDLFSKVHGLKSQTKVKKGVCVVLN